MDQTIYEKSVTPKFVYAHLLIPHPPMLTDSLGNLKNISAAMYETNTRWASLKTSYADYMHYANSILEKMVTDIQQQDSTAVIVFASDHGFRSFPDQQDQIFNNQCAVYIPGSSYEGFYDNVSLVNLMRLVLNNVLGQKIPLLGDSLHRAK
jgi:arylsulfatase A-like enzyme